MTLSAATDGDISNKEMTVINFLFNTLPVFEKANNGTLLIDNVSEIPLETQTKILRVLTDQKFHRVNGNKEILTNSKIANFALYIWMSYFYI